MLSVKISSCGALRVPTGHLLNPLKVWAVSTRSVMEEDYLQEMCSGKSHADNASSIEDNLAQICNLYSYITLEKLQIQRGLIKYRECFWI